MKTYLYICRTTTGGHSWKYEATFPSHSMALEYGSKIATDFIHCPWFMSLDVWMMGPDGEESYAGYITLVNTPYGKINTNTERRPI